MIQKNVPMRNLLTPRTMDVLRIMLYEQPASSPIVEISLIVLLKALTYHPSFF